MSKLVQTGIGGSSIGAIADYYTDATVPRIDPWKTALDVYDRIVNGPTEKAISFRARIGQIVEPEIFKEYCKRRGFKQKQFKRNIEIAMPGRPEFRGELDAMKTDLERGMDCKLVGRYAESGYGDEGTDDMPTNYLCQLAWYRLLSGVGIMDLACWFDSQKEGEHYREWVYEKDTVLEGQLLAAAERFWAEHVIPEIPPEARYPEDNGKMSKIYPADSLDMIEATDEICFVTGQAAGLKLKRKMLDDELALLEAQIKAFIGQHEGAKVGDFKVTWKASKPRSVTDYKTLLRVIRLRLSEGKLYTSVGDLDKEIAKYTEEKPGNRPLILPKAGD